MSGVADRVYIDRTHAPLNVAQPRAFRVLFAEQIRHKRLHSRNVEHNARRAVADKGNRADVDVPSVFVKLNPFVS